MAVYPFRDDDLRLNMVIFQSYVKLPEGIKGLGPLPPTPESEGRTGSFDRRLAVLSNTMKVKAARGHSTDS